MAFLARGTRLYNRPQDFFFEDDFGHTLNTTNDYTATLSDSGSATVVDGAFGILPIIPSDGTVADNDEAYVQSKLEFWLFGDNHPMACEARIQYAEANTNTANVVFGLANAPTANFLIDDGGGIRTSGSAVCIYKVDGTTVWKCLTMMNGTQTISTSTTTAGGTAYQTLYIEVVDHSSTEIEVVFQVDGKYLIDSTSNQRIVHRVTIASPTEMALVAGQKNGAITAVETLNVDYWWGSARR